MDYTSNTAGHDDIGMVKIPEEDFVSLLHHGCKQYPSDGENLIYKNELKTILEGQKEIAAALAETMLRDAEDTYRSLTLRKGRKKTRKEIFNCILNMLEAILEILTIDSTIQLGIRDKIYWIFALRVPEDKEIDEGFEYYLMRFLIQTRDWISLESALKNGRIRITTVLKEFYFLNSFDDFFDQDFYDFYRNIIEPLAAKKARTYNRAYLQSAVFLNSEPNRQ